MDMNKESEEYARIVRDNIPSLLEKEGYRVNYGFTAWPDRALSRELEREIENFKKTYKKSETLEILANISEICIAYAQKLGFTEEDLNKVRLDKKEKEGGFEKDYFVYSISKTN